MSTVNMAPGLHWVGALDPDLRTFDLIMNAPHGTTYNSYLVEGKKECALIETVKAGFTESYMENLSSLATIKLRGKKAVVFGSYGWSGEAVKLVEERLKGIKIKIPAEGFRAQLFPTEADLENCRELGAKLVEA
ncbi:MAG TPA: hypothetical protein ENH32_04980 [Proteobacteria bacterium]|nr:type A flavoprotein fprA [bacterium BMS3Abin14]HDL53309.1 hypothetical protein [Pseudomonadota bacterium]